MRKKKQSLGDGGRRKSVEEGIWGQELEEKML